jgi:site-specific DNA-cytosine methylase
VEFYAGMGTMRWSLERALESDAGAVVTALASIDNSEVANAVYLANYPHEDASGVLMRRNVEHLSSDLHETDFTSTVSCLCPRLLAPLATFGDAPRPVTSECSPVEIDDDAMVSIASVCRPRGPDSGPGGEDI